MPKEKQRPEATAYYQRQGERDFYQSNPGWTTTHVEDNQFYEPDERCSTATDVTERTKNTVGSRGPNVVAGRLKKAMLKPNPIALKRREYLRRKKEEKRRQLENSYFDDNARRRDKKNSRPQHRRNYSYSSESECSHTTGSLSYFDSSIDDCESNYNKNRDWKDGKDKKLLSPEDLPTVYIVRQQYGVIAIIFGVAQVLILLAMVHQCGGLAPIFNPMINPMVGPYPDVLSYWGAKNTYLIINEGEWWRLFSPIMLHAGVFHILGNVGIQLDQGVLFEREWGSLYWILIYIVSGAGGNLLSAIYLPNSLSVGSSGAVCGLFGAKLAEVFCRTCEMTDTGQKRLAYRVRTGQCKEALCFVFMVAAFSFIPMVDWASHLGGFIGGLFIGFALFGPGCYYCVFAILFTLGGYIITIFLFSFGIKYLYTQVEADDGLGDFCAYFKEHGGIEDYECVCQTWSSFFGDDDNGE